MSSVLCMRCCSGQTDAPSCHCQPDPADDECSTAQGGDGTQELANAVGIVGRETEAIDAAREQGDAGGKSVAGHLHGLTGGLGRGNEQGKRMEQLILRCGRPRGLLVGC